MSITVQAQQKNLEAFSFAAHAMLQQARKSVTGTTASFEGPACAYRGKNGDRCGVGHLISDADYHPSFEGKIAEMVQLRVPGLQGISLEILQGIQLVHDTQPPKNWACALSVLGQMFYALNLLPATVFIDLRKAPEIRQIQKENQETAEAAAEVTG